jgi:hypothetical protein
LTTFILAKELLFRDLYWRISPAFRGHVLWNLTWRIVATSKIAEPATGRHPEVGEVHR